VSQRKPPKLPDPASSPRKHKSGRQERDRPIFSRSGGSREDFTQWEVEVTPLVATTTVGREVAGAAAPAGAGERGTVFEIRAAYFGVGLEVFGSQPNTRMIPTTHTEDLGLAQAIARRLVEILEPGGRSIDIVALAQEVERRRRA
jgi:hypothetical protein